MSTTPAPIGLNRTQWVASLKGMFGEIVSQIMRGERDNPKHFAQIPNPLIDSLPGDTFILIALKEGAVAAHDLLGQQWDIELGSSFGRWEQGQDIYLVGLLSS